MPLPLSPAPTPSTLVIRDLGRRDYMPVWQAMQTFTRRRTPHTADEIWLLEHPPVYTLGLNGKTEHVLAAGEIPLIPSDRGGQVTYHGPGQLVAYLLFDLKRLGLGVRAIVSLIERSVIAQLAEYGIAATNRPDAPGVYVKGAKIAALGLRIKQGCSYHGLSFNIDMDLAPFGRINPCGYPDMAVTQLADLNIEAKMPDVAAGLVRHIHRQLGYDQTITEPGDTLFTDD